MYITIDRRERLPHPAANVALTKTGANNMTLILLVVGLAAGVLAGLFGVGGGILFTPALFLVFSEAGVARPVIWTIASSLFCTFVSALSSSVRQGQQQNLYWSQGIRVGIFGAVGTFVGKQLSTSVYYSEQEFVVFFSLLLLFAAYVFARRGRQKSEQSDPSAIDTIRFRRGSLIGGAGGFLASLAGIGGGTAMVPLMNLYYKLPIKQAVSVSSLAIVIISLAGWLQLGAMDPSGGGLTAYSFGYVDFGAALPLVIGGLAGGFAGAWLNLKLNRRLLQWGFALLALSVAVKLLTDVFG